MNQQDLYDIIVELGLRRGYFWPSFEIYGGVGGFIDLGPLGTQIMHKLVDKWRDTFIRRESLVEISTPIITPKRVFEASGHVEHFRDPMTECLKCKKKFRADQLITEAIQKNVEQKSLQQLDETIEDYDIRCPECGGRLSRTQHFITMFTTNIGPYSDSIGYARPEAAQGMFIDFKRVFEITREKLPLGIAQIGRAMRNEISPRQGPIRLREFTIMEFEFFFDPEEPQCEKINQVLSDKIRIIPGNLRAEGKEKVLEVTIQDAIKEGYILSDWLAYFMAVSVKFLKDLGIPFEKQLFEEKLPSERAHYSLQTFDHQVWLSRWGWTEVAGFANRTDYDLSRHNSFSTVDMQIFKRLEKPRITKGLTVKPNASELGKAFKEKLHTITEHLLKANPSSIKQDLATKGYYEVDDSKIYPHMVRFEEGEKKETGYRFTPHAVEPSFGAERLFYALLEYAYRKKQDRVIMAIPKTLAPYEVAVFPLVNKDGLDALAQQIFHRLIEAGFYTFLDDKGSIGRRYARADEAGVPLGVTIDYQTKEENTVTIRDRDSWKQYRINIDVLPQSIKSNLKTN